DIALRAGHWDEAIRCFERSAELARAMPGVVPMPSLCMLPWALAAAGRPDAAAAALADARATPDLARSSSRPVLVSAAEALLAGDADGLDAAIAGAPDRMPLDIALMRVVGAHVIGGPARARWLREALDLYDAAGASLEADRVRQALRDAGGAVPPHLPTPGPVAPELAEQRLTGRGLHDLELVEQVLLTARTVQARC